MNCAGCGHIIDRKDAAVGDNRDGHAARYSYALLIPGGIYKAVWHEHCYDERSTLAADAPAAYCCRCGLACEVTTLEVYGVAESQRVSACCVKPVATRLGEYGPYR